MESSILLDERLTRRENDILLLLAQNLSDQEIAERLVLSLYTVKWYTRQIYSKLGVRNRREAAAVVQKLGQRLRETRGKRSVHNLPRQISTFIGREHEIDQVVRLIWEHPLVTLTGSGGVGKTRLAQASAEELVDDFSDGIWFVELAVLSDPQLVPLAVANALGIHAKAGKHLLEAIFSYLFDRQVLLMLDNCEHLVEACAELTQTLLARLPRPKILVTSREPLGVNGEVTFRVPSLALPPGEDCPDIESYSAVRLFLERAREHQTDFTLAGSEMPALARICCRLDGIPLAIELAAARAKLLSVEQIANRLDDVFGLLTGGCRSALPRHKTLRACIDSSYQMLTPAEQLLLARLSVFAGGWTLQAAEQVCADVPAGFEPEAEACLRSDQILDRLSGLVDKSLVQFHPISCGVPRYNMLETVRQFGRERLEERGEVDLLRNRHLAYFTALTGAIPPGDDVKVIVKWSRSILGDLDNIRLALDWSLATDCKTGLQLCLNTSQAIHVHQTPEALDWLDHLLAGEAAEIAGKGDQAGDPERLVLRGTALDVISHWRSFWGQREQAMQAGLESKAIFEAMGEQGEMYLASALTGLGIIEMVSDPDQSCLYLETALNYFNRHEDSFELAFCYKVLGNLYGYLGDQDRARWSLEEALRLARKYRFWGELGMLLNMLGWVERLNGNHNKGLELFIQGQAAYAQVDEFDHVAGCMYDRALLAWCLEDDVELLRLCDEMRKMGENSDSVVFALNVEEMLARREWAMGAYKQAARRAEAALQAYQPYYFSFTGCLVYILGRIAIHHKQFDQAARYFYQFADAADAPRWRMKAYSLHSFGLLAAAQAERQPEQAERATVLFAAQEALFRWLPRLFAPVEQRAYEQALATVRNELGEEAFEAAWARGQSMPRKEVYALALEGMSEDE